MASSFVLGLTIYMSQPTNSTHMISPHVDYDLYKSMDSWFIFNILNPSTAYAIFPPKCNGSNATVIWGSISSIVVLERNTSRIQKCEHLHICSKKKSFINWKYIKTMENQGQSLCLQLVPHGVPMLWVKHQLTLIKWIKKEKKLF